MHPEFSTPNLSFSIHSKDYHHGQMDMQLITEVDGKFAGYINYSIYEKQPSIQMIHVEDEFRKRLGIGKAMVKHLQKQFPDTEINWGTTTPEGTALYNSLSKQIIYNPLYKKYKDLLVELEEKEKKFTDLIENKNLTPEQRKRISNNWHNVHNMVYTLEKRLRHLSASKTLIRTDESKRTIS